MIDVMLVYKDGESVQVNWLYDIWKHTSVVPDSLELKLGKGLVESEREWLVKLLNWVYHKENDNRDIRINGAYYVVDDFANG